MYMQKFCFFPTVLGLLSLIHRDGSFNKIPKKYKSREAEKYQLLINILIESKDDDYYLTQKGIETYQQLSENEIVLFRNLL